MSPEQEVGLMQGLMAHPGWTVLKERLQQFAESEWSAAARPGQNAHDMSLHVGAAGAYRVAWKLPENIVRMAVSQANIGDKLVGVGSGHPNVGL